MVLNDVTSRLAHVLRMSPTKLIEKEVCEVQQILLEHLLDLEPNLDLDV